MEKQKIKNVIEKLKSLDLSTYPVEDVRKLLMEFQLTIPIIAATLEPGRIIVRGTPYIKFEKFSQVSRLSYKPQDLNKSYQRASTLQENMFYGRLTSEIPTEPCARMCVLAEIGKVYRKNAASEKLMFSSWQVIKPIKLVAVLQSQNYIRPCQKVISLQTQYREKFKNLSSKEIMDYIASEFAKEDVGEKEDYKYIISACYTKMVCDSGYDGVAYPSVRIDGAGINVAIKPDAVNQKLNFLGAVECDVTRKKKDISIKNKYVSFLKEDGTLGYRPITNRDYNTNI